MDVAKFDDAYFKSAEKKSKKQSEDGFFQEAAEKAPLPSEYVANQKAVDAALLGKLRWACGWHWGWVSARAARKGVPFWRGAGAAAELAASQHTAAASGTVLKRDAATQTRPACLLSLPAPAPLPRSAATTSRATSPAASRCALATGRT